MCGKTAVRRQDMEMGMEIYKVSVGVNAHHHARRQVRPVCKGTEAFCDHPGRHPAEFSQQAPVIAEIHPEHLRHGENYLPVRDVPEDLGIEPLGEGDGPLRVTGGAEISSLAGVGEQKFAGTVRTPNPGEALPQITAGEVFVN
jgi:hypothetical protein